VNAGLSSPCEPEETDGKHDSSDAAERKTSLGRKGSSSLDEVPNVSFVLEDVGDDGGDHTETDSDKGERGDSWRPSTVLTEDDWDSPEE